MAPPKYHCWRQRKSQSHLTLTPESLCTASCYRCTSYCASPPTPVHSDSPNHQTDAGETRMLCIANKKIPLVWLKNSTICHGLSLVFDQVLQSPHVSDWLYWATPRSVKLKGMSNTSFCYKKKAKFVLKV